LGLQACRLWKRETKRGTLFTGTMGGIRVTVVQNDMKRHDDDADYLLTFDQNYNFTASNHQSDRGE